MLKPTVFFLQLLLQPSMAASLYLLLVVLSLFGCYCCSFSSTSLTLLVLFLSTSSPFIFSKIRQLHKAGSIREPFIEILPDDVMVEESETSEDDGLLESNSPPLENKGSSLESLVANEKIMLETVGLPLPSSDSLVSDDEFLPEAACWSTENSEDSISDDESLIEIALSEGHYVAPMMVQQDLSRGVSPPADFSPESMLRQHGLMELFSEISEEDNLIEIDISMGSIKCSRFEIEA